jgi:hypothetical protein
VLFENLFWAQIKWRRWESPDKKEEGDSPEETVQIRKKIDERNLFFAVQFDVMLRLHP